jgi:hypothetical protein
MPNITALTSDYDAIERAIRETTRGRWFLSCYLERNRSAETRVLLDAIARLEAAVRDSGHVVDTLAPAEALSKIADALTDARVDITRMVAGEDAPMTPAMSRFAFGSIPRSTRAGTQTIREAATLIERAATTLNSAGVFHGVAVQILEKTAEIMRACSLQEQSIGQMQRIAMLINDVESEIATVTGRRESQSHAPAAPKLRCIAGSDRQAPVEIPEDVMEELSLALLQRSLTLDEDYLDLPEHA